MKGAFTRRLEALEKRLIPAQRCDGPVRETEFSRRLLERLEAGQRRVGEGRERRGLPPTVDAVPCDGQTAQRMIVEVLHAGRDRSALDHRALMEARRSPSSE